MAESDACQPSSSTDQQRDAYPVAVAQPVRRFPVIWLFPLAALVFAAWLGWRAWAMRGIGITIQLQDGHGLKAGDDVRYRGISVGRIEAVTLMPDLDGILVSARLKSDAEDLAREGSRFWVVRPHLHLTRVEGLETLIGPRYLAVLPADSSSEIEGQRAETAATNTPSQASSSRSAPRPRSQRHFVGLDSPPTVESSQPGDLEIILQAQQRGSLHPGAPVTYRQTRVGTIISVGLNGDGSAVEARAHIERPFVALIRPTTRFWDVGGLQMDVGLTGVSIEIDSAEALLAGGVALATPPPPSPNVTQEIVRTGHRFELASEAESEWLQWQPLAVIGSSLLPPGVSPPSPLRATIGWKQGRWFRGERTVSGWVLQTEEGLLGPADLLKPGERADPGTVVLEVAGAIVPLDSPPQWEHNGLALLPSARVHAPAWPKSQMRRATQPEECLVIADAVDQPLPLAPSRLTAGQEQWQIDRAVSLSDAFHGACVVARSDGKVIGMVLVQRGTGVIAMLPGG